MTRDLRVQTLSPYLMKNKLLTVTEAEHLTQLTQRKVIKDDTVQRTFGPFVSNRGFSGC